MPIEATDSHEAPRVAEIPVALIEMEQRESIIQWIAQMALREVRGGGEEDGDDRK